MISMLDVIPSNWKIGAALLLVAGLVGVDVWRVHEADKAGFDRAITERAARDAVSVVTRIQENATAAAHNSDINKYLTKDQDEKLTPVITRIVTERVRVGEAICGSAASAKTDDARSGHEADSPGRLVRGDIERDLIALKIAVEKDLATGRTCQAWGREHGFVE